MSVANILRRNGFIRVPRHLQFFMDNYPTRLKSKKYLKRAPYSVYMRTWRLGTYEISRYDSKWYMSHDNKDFFSEGTFEKVFKEFKNAFQTQRASNEKQKQL